MSNNRFCYKNVLLLKFRIKIILGGKEISYSYFFSKKWKKAQNVADQKLINLQ